MDSLTLAILGLGLLFYVKDGPPSPFDFLGGVLIGFSLLGIIY